MNVIIMQGVPGSGKSTYCHKLGPHHSVSADKHFMLNGRYIFDVSKLGAAHASCLRQYVELLRGKTDFPIVVDNTNTRVEEIAPYYALAEAYGYRVKIVRIDCDVEVAAARNVHGVPRDNVYQMAQNISAIEMPKRWKLEVWTR